MITVKNIPSALFQPIDIGRISFKNRIVLAAMDTHTAHRDGSASSRMVRFLELRAQGGAGAVTTGAAFIDDEAGRFSHGQLGAHDDSLIGPLHRIAEAVHVHGARAILQLCHAGRQKFIAGTPMISASPVAWESTGQEPREASRDEIKGIVKGFARAAARARAAEFDAVEIHGAHGYLITNFLSPFTNRRADEYGGSLRNRMRLALEVAGAVKEAVGGDFPVIFRLSVEEHVPGGIPLEETLQTAGALKEIGIDALHLSGGIHQRLDWEIPPMYRPPGINVEAAVEVKRQVGIPVIVAGGINRPRLMGEIVAAGKADLVALARPLLADPFLPRKLKTGDEESIRPCIRCNEICIGRGPKEIRCAVNAEANRELGYPLLKARESKKVLVVGGGPGGLEAAATAAERGHSVTLFERQAHLGGALFPASRPSFKQDLKAYLEWAVRRVAESPVKIRTGLKATPELCRMENPDAVIVAAGARPRIPDLPGLRQANVLDPCQALTGEGGFAGGGFEEGAAVVVIGAGLVGCETAWHLSEAGCRVTLTSRRPAGELAPDAEKTARLVLRELLPERLERILGNIRLQGIEGARASFEGPGGSLTVLEADCFVICAGYEPCDGLFRQLQEEAGFEVFAIGDCVGPRRIWNAVHEANDVVRHL